MMWQFNPLALLLFASSAILVGLAVLAYRRNRSLAVRLFLLFTLSAAALNFAYGMELLAAHETMIFAWVNVQFIFLYMPVLWLFFVLAHGGHEHWFTRRSVLLALLPSTFLTLLAWTNELHGLIWTTTGTVTMGSLVFFDRTYGGAFYAAMGYLYAVDLLSMSVMIIAIRRSPAVYRTQLQNLLWATLLPLIGNLVTVIGLSPLPKLDLAPFGYALACILIAWSLYRHRLLDIVPLAYRQVIQSMNDSVFITDSQRQIFDANQAAARWVGYASPDDLIGLPLQSVLHISETKMAALVESKESPDEIQLVSNRKMYYFEPRVSSLYDHHNQLRGHVIVLRDITEHKTAQEIVKRYASKLEIRNQDLQAFSHTVAHDLKNPVSGMIIQAQVLMMQASHDLLSPEILAQNLSEIERSGHRMINIIEGLLLLAQMNETDEDTLLRVNATYIARSAVDRFGWEIRNENIDVQVEGDLPAVFAHAAWLEEVFANLIENAIKYLGENNPEPRITIRGYPLDDHNRFEIQDNGVGIKPEDQAKLFEKFSRFHENEASGLGLGLAIVLRIVKRLGGEVGVQSEPGIGSTFWFTLPALRRSLKIEDVRQQDTEQRLAVHSVEKV